jgi:hypothetical protein
MTIETVKRTVRLASDEGRSCDHCTFRGQPHELDTQINHYIERHGYRLLHLGTETTAGDRGEAFHRVVAVLGHDAPPALAPDEETLEQYMASRRSVES